MQEIVETNLETFFGIRFLASEYPPEREHGVRIDTLGIDENLCPVVIEYKRTVQENVINQGLFYLDWLMNHKKDFEWLVKERIGEGKAQSVEWAAPRLLCIAGDFTKFDEHAIKQMNRNIELIRYRKYDDDRFLLEFVNAAAAQGRTRAPAGKGQGPKAWLPKAISKAPTLQKEHFEKLRTFALALGDDVEMKEMQGYFAFKRHRNFACITYRPHRNLIQVYMTLSPETVEHEEGFTRDVRRKSTGVPGGLELTIRSDADLPRAMRHIERNYHSV